ncbi:MAG: hypothetical protein ABIR47_13850 [Candidatus Kapaibacterium sp.]
MGKKKKKLKVTEVISRKHRYGLELEQEAEDFLRKLFADARGKGAGFFPPAIVIDAAMHIVGRKQWDTPGAEKPEG